MNLKKMESYFRVNLLGPGPRLMKNRIYRAAVSQRLRNTGLELVAVWWAAFVLKEPSICIRRSFYF